MSPSVCKDGDSARIADFLGELISVPSTEHPSPQLRAARNDPQVMATWLARSFGEWLAAECAVAPLAIVLEDLHWGDLPSVSVPGRRVAFAGGQAPHGAGARAARGSRDLPGPLAGGGEAPPRPWTARPPRRRAAGQGGAWRRDLQRTRSPASSSAPTATPSISRSSSGASTTAAATRCPRRSSRSLESRLERLEPEARRIVRAASVFGEVFWQGAVACLLGGGGSAADLARMARSAPAARVHLRGERLPLRGRPRVRLPARPAARGRVRDAHGGRSNDGTQTRGRVAGEGRREGRPDDGRSLREGRAAQARHSLARARSPYGAGRRQRRGGDLAWPARASRAARWAPSELRCARCRAPAS